MNMKKRWTSYFTKATGKAKSYTKSQLITELKSDNCIAIQTQGQQVVILTAQKFQEEAFKYHPVCKAQCLHLLNSNPCYNQTVPTIGKALP